MNTRTYYGDDRLRALTYLEFGEINLDRGTKAVWDFQLHQRAYDWLMLARYTNDLLAYLDMTKALGAESDDTVFQIYNREVHHADDASTNLGKLIALTVTAPRTAQPSFHELGQTLFGCIEGMEFCQHLLKAKGIAFPAIDLKTVRWEGVDISAMFNRLSSLLHVDYDVTANVRTPEPAEPVDVFFSKGISLLYAVRQMPQLFETIERGRCAVFDYSFAVHRGTDTTIGSGKTVRYLPFAEFLTGYRARGGVLYVNLRKSHLDGEKDRLWLDCVYGEEVLCRAFTERDTTVRQALQDSLSDVPAAGRFLGDSPVPQWVPLEGFLNEPRVKAALKESA